MRVDIKNNELKKKKNVIKQYKALKVWIIWSCLKVYFEHWRVNDGVVWFAFDGLPTFVVCEKQKYFAFLELYFELEY